MKTIGWIFVGIVVFAVVMGVARGLTQAVRSDPGQVQWENTFLGVQSKVNREGIEPARVMLAAYSCETDSACITAVRDLSVALKPYRDTLIQSIDKLATSTPPAEWDLLHSAYVKMLKLRLEAVSLYIEGSEQNDYALLAQGDEAWFKAIDAAANVMDRIQELNK